MKKTWRGEIFHYPNRRKLIKEDIIEIYGFFQEIDENVTITIDGWKLDDISEIHHVKQPFKEITISLFHTKYTGTYVMITDHITLRLDDIDDMILLGLKSKIESVLKNRKNAPSGDSVYKRYKSIIDGIIIGIILIGIGLIIKHILGL